MRNPVKWAIGITVVVALAIGFGPTLIEKMGYKISKQPKESTSAPVNIKVSGTISTIDGLTVLTTPVAKNHYILIGSKLDEISKVSDKTVYVFGTLIEPKKTTKVRDMFIRASIDVSQFDVNDFTIGTPVSPEMLEAIKQKVQDQVELRTRVLKQLHLENSGYEVISGKLVIIKVLLLRQAKESTGLMVVDKYGDQYLLTGQLKYPYKDYASLADQNLDVVVVGSLQAPDMITILPMTKVLPNFTFGVHGLYNNNEELSEVIARK